MTQMEEVQRAGTEQVLRNNGGCSPPLPRTGRPVTSGLTEGAAQVAQDGIRLVQGEVSVLELGELPVQLGGGTALSEVLSLAAPHGSFAPQGAAPDPAGHEHSHRRP